MFVNVYGVKKSGVRHTKPIMTVECRDMEHAEEVYREKCSLKPWAYPEYPTLEFEDMATDEVSRLLELV